MRRLRAQPRERITAETAQVESRAVSRYMAHGRVSLATLDGRLRRASARWPGLADILHDRLPAVVQVGDWRDPRSRRLTDEAPCELCRRGFTAHDPRTRRCLACRDGAARQRRHRGGGVATKRYRFEGTNHLAGQQAFSVSFNRGYGDQALLEATAGVIETTDAEEAKHLRAMTFLLEI
jgi:hypothetical protein